MGKLKDFFLELFKILVIAFAVFTFTANVIALMAGMFDESSCRIGHNYDYIMPARYLGCWLARERK